MYGVDVISCLNKAISNDDKYVDEKAYFVGKGYGEEYLIDVCIDMKGPLKESIELTIIKMGESKTVFAGSPDLLESDALTMKDVGFEAKTVRRHELYKV